MYVRLVEDNFFDLFIRKFGMKYIAKGKKLLKYPSNWNEINVNQYILISENIKTSLKNDEKPDNIEFLYFVLGLFNSKETVEHAKITLNDLKKVGKSLQFLTQTQPFSEVKQIVNIDGVQYGFLNNFDLLTFAEFLDLETIIKRTKGNITEELHQFLAVFYRPIEKLKIQRSNRLKFWQKKTVLNIQLEDYDLDSRKNRAEIFKEHMSITEGFNLIGFFFEFRTRLFKKFAALFKSKNVGIGTGQIKEFSNRWGWYISLIDASNNDLLKVSDVLKQNVSFVLTYLMFLKDRNEVNQSIQKEANDKMKRR